MKKSDKKDTPLGRAEATLVADWLKKEGKHLPNGFYAVWRMTPTKVSKLYDVSLVGVIEAARRSEQ